MNLQVGFGDPSRVPRSPAPQPPHGAPCRDFDFRAGLVSLRMVQDNASNTNTDENNHEN